MSMQRFAARAETFGLEGSNPWALDALRLVFNVPRAYEPLVAAWDDRYSGTRKALDRLADGGFVVHQPPVIIDVRSGETATTKSRPVARYRATASGRRLGRAARDDARVIQDTFVRCTDDNAPAVAQLLCAFDLDDLHGRTGVSAPMAIIQADMAERTGRWWVSQFKQRGLIRELPVRIPDRRELVPAHWRITRDLCRQMKAVLAAYPEPHSALAAELRISRTKFLKDIDPARIGADGATDFDHDVTAQRVLAAMLRSDRALAGASFLVEPRYTLTADATSHPWKFDTTGNELVLYQPDAVFIERTTTTRRCIIEYERYQSRRDAWNHIERFLGHLALRTLAFEPAVLRFVVDTEARLRSYVELIEAFADYAQEHPECMPGNDVILAATTVERLDWAGDCLDDRRWYRIELPNSSNGQLPLGGCCVVHDPKRSPYDDYFARGK